MGAKAVTEAGEVKIFGERNTGTHALTAIVEQNSRSHCLPAVESAFHPLLSRIVNDRRMPLPAAIIEGLNDWMFRDPSPLNAWKHCATNFADASAFDGRLVLFTVRHPASWVQSFFNKPYHRLGRRVSELGAFIETPWKTVGRERLGGASFLPLELYATKMKAHRELAQKLSERGIPYHFIRHEDLVLRQSDVFAAIRNDLKRAKPRFEELRGRAKPEAKSLDEYRAYYGEERWRSAFQGLEPLVNSQVDWASLAEFNYAPL